MLRSLLFTLAVLTCASHAAALEVKSCDDANIGLTELIAPVAKNSRTFKDDKVSVYVVDTVEPVCCAAGVAIVLPNPQDELGGSTCVAVVGVASVQLDETTAVDDPAKGLRLSIPTRVFNDAADSAPGEPMRLHIDVDKGTVDLE